MSDDDGRQRIVDVDVENYPHVSSSASLRRRRWMRWAFHCDFDVEERLELDTAAFVFDVSLLRWTTR